MGLRATEPTPHGDLCSCGRGPDNSCWHAPLVLCGCMGIDWQGWDVAGIIGIILFPFRPLGSQMSRCWMLLNLLQVLQPSSHRTNSSSSWCVAAAMDLINRLLACYISDMDALAWALVDKACMWPISWNPSPLGHRIVCDFAGPRATEPTPPHCV